ncbi:MAG: hypothetical protein NTX57_05775, partial [Armatimonadetes bacterium]|nr:hypothetical protein [Armatimonadota bacterium]
MSLEIVSGVSLDESRYHYLAQMLRATGQREAYLSLPDAADLLTMLEFLLAGLEAIGPEGAQVLWESSSPDAGALHPDINQAMALSFAAHLFGPHRFHDPYFVVPVTPDDSAGREVLGQEARDVFALVGEVVASPKGSPELLALALLGYSAR